MTPHTDGFSGHLPAKDQCRLAAHAEIGMGGMRMAVGVARERRWPHPCSAIDKSGGDHLIAVPA